MVQTEMNYLENVDIDQGYLISFSNLSINWLIAMLRLSIISGKKQPACPSTAD